MTSTQSTVQIKKTPVKKIQKKVETIKIPDILEIPIPIVEIPIKISTFVQSDLQTDIPIEIETQFKNLLKELTVIRETLKVFEISIKNMKISYIKKIRELNKSNKKKKNKKMMDSNGETIPHGFAKPCDLSPALIEFLGLEPGSQLKSPTVTKLVGEYVRANNLALPENGSIFKCDKKLHKILGDPVYIAVKKSPELGINHSYWNLQKTMKKNGHFIRNPVVISQ